MLIKDKYNPLLLKDFVINKKIATKYDKFYDKNFIPNTIVYGNNGVGKYTFVKCLLNSIYDKEIFTKNVVLKIGSKEHNILSSNYHFEILVDKYNNNINNICEILDFLTESKEINGVCNLKIVIIRNICYCKNDILSFIKNKIESSANNYRFFLITNKISTINNKYRGIFHFINFVQEDKNIIINYFQEKIPKFNKALFTKLIKDSSNLNYILTNYELGLLTKTKSFSELKIKKIMGLIKESIKNPDNIIKIREEIYELNIKNLNFNDILKKILKLLLEDKNLSHDKKFKIIQLYSSYSQKIVNCFKEQIHYEALLSGIIYVYHS